MATVTTTDWVAYAMLIIGVIGLLVTIFAVLQMRGILAYATSGEGEVRKATKKDKNIIIPLILAIAIPVLLAGVVGGIVGLVGLVLYVIIAIIWLANTNNYLTVNFVLRMLGYHTYAVKFRDYDETCTVVTRKQLTKDTYVFKYCDTGTTLFFDM
jgi:hypothetical protein